ncbi:MAG: HypC/HybG/HupF family hydrogenase formation chaperone [Leptolyngbya sp. RL_3_1]|nr:HypC/HybG/HupF family hydrogenase formation chaperone [Leptolyngbya sp. RL_3_1]
MCLSVPGKVISITDAKPGQSTSAEDETLWKMGKVSFGGVLKQVSLAYVPEVQIGDYVLVHVGFALSIIDEDEAAQTLSYLDQLEAV